MSFWIINTSWTVLLIRLYSFTTQQNLRSADEYYLSELAQLETETKAMDMVAQKLELELRKAMDAGTIFL